VLALGVAGCATARPAATASEGQPPAELRERAAALFDAAAHGDLLRLKTLVDWGRWRTVQARAVCSSDQQAAELLSRLEAEPQPSPRFVDDAVGKVRTELAEVTAGTLPPEPQPGMMNATLAGWRRGPEEGAPPSLARLQSLAADSLEGAAELTYRGARRVTLVFVGGLYVGMVEAR
jgi:hypothetical protein